MFGDAAALHAFARALFGDVLPKEFVLFEQVLVARGEIGGGPEGSASLVKKARALAAESDPVGAVFGVSLAGIEPKKWARASSNLGQLLVGRLAERAFEAKYRETMGTNELVLEDDRMGRGDTDYRVRNGKGRPVFRINIKFHGTLFRKAQEMVGLEPEDCFALATYKINLATEKQEKEHLPYLFVIVSVPDLKGSLVGERLPEDVQHFAALVASTAPGKLSRKRDIEDRLVDWLTGEAPNGAFRRDINAWQGLVDGAEWRVISARRADRILREKLFERVFAVRVRSFARNYGNAELDMHFSFREDMTPLSEFLETLREGGLPQLVGYLERGTY